MTYGVNKIFVTIVSFLIVISFVQPVFAREDYFKSAIGNVRSSIQGAETVFSTTEGSLNVFSEKGETLAGFPLVFVDETPISSPLLVDITDTSEKEILVVLRNSTGYYFLRVYKGDGTQLANVEIGEDVYFDPMELTVPAQNKKDVLISTVSGKISSYNFAENNLTLIFDAGKPVAASPSPDGAEIVVSYPTENKLSILVLGAGKWTETKSFSLARAIIYPVMVASNGDLYGIDADFKLTALQKSTGLMVSGFPVALEDKALDSPFLADWIVGSNKEIGISLQNGKTIFLDLSGKLIASSVGKKQFLDGSTDISNGDNLGIFSGVGNYGSEVQDQSQHRMNSLWSVLRRFVPPAVGCSPPLSGDWEISTNCTILGDVIAPGNVTVKNGAVFTIESGSSLKIDLKNYFIKVIKGSGILVIHGGKISQ